MRAVVFYNVGDIRYETDWPEPTPGPGQVKIATSWCGICGTDMEDYERGAVIPVDKPHPLSGQQAPLVIGHEFSGHVAELGPGVTRLEIGQRVAVECIRSCMECYWCQRGEYSVCTSLVSIGQQQDGACADYVVVPAQNCIPLPEHLGEDIAAMAEPLAVMVRAIRKGEVMTGDVVTVLGAGAIGLCGIGVARAAGASKVISVAHGGRRAEVAAELGATAVLDSRGDGWRDAYLELTDGVGSDVVIDAGANAAAVHLAVELTRRQGRCVLNSVIDDDIPIPGLDVMLGEKEIVGSAGHRTEQEFKWALQLLADGRVNVEPIITDRIPLENAVEMGFDRLRGDRNQIKILVTPREDLLP